MIENNAKAALLSGRERTVIPPDQYRDRFRKSMESYFWMIPDKWIKIPGRETSNLPPCL
jgi:hypothetical protein